MIYEIPEHNHLDLRVKWSLDGCETLEAAASALRTYADELDKLHVQGWHFEDVVDDGCASIVHDDPLVVCSSHDDARG